MKKLHKRVRNFLQKHTKALKTLHKNLIKSLKTYQNQMKKIVFILMCILTLMACGSTKVSVDKPASGTQTTITVTTNNPITTSVDANANAQIK